MPYSYNFITKLGHATLLWGMLNMTKTPAILTKYYSYPGNDNRLNIWYNK